MTLRSAVVFLLVALLSAVKAQGSCSVNVGGILYRHESLESDRVPTLSFGCDVQRFDVRVHYFSRQDVMRQRPWGPTQYVTDAHASLSFMRTWNVRPGRVSSILGAGFHFQSRNPPKCSLEPPLDAIPYTVCRGDPWVPLPLEFSLMGALAGEHWSLSLTHVSNAYLHSYNWGRNVVEIGYRW